MTRNMHPIIRAGMASGVGILLLAIVLSSALILQRGSRWSSILEQESPGGVKRETRVQMARQIASLSEALNRVSHVVQRMAGNKFESDERDVKGRLPGVAREVEGIKDGFWRRGEERAFGAYSEPHISRYSGPHAIFADHQPKAGQQGLQVGQLGKLGYWIAGGGGAGASGLRSVNHYDDFYIDPSLRPAGLDGGHGRVGDGLQDVGTDEDSYWTVRDPDDSRLDMIPPQGEMTRIDLPFKKSLCVWPYCRLRSSPTSAEALRRSLASTRKREGEMLSAQRRIRQRYSAYTQHHHQDEQGWHEDGRVVSEGKAAGGSGERRSAEMRNAEERGKGRRGEESSPRFDGASESAVQRGNEGRGVGQREVEDSSGAEVGARESLRGSDGHGKNSEKGQNAYASARMVVEKQDGDIFRGVRTEGGDPPISKGRHFLTQNRSEQAIISSQGNSQDKSEHASATVVRARQAVHSIADMRERSRGSTVERHRAVNVRGLPREGFWASAPSLNAFRRLIGEGRMANSSSSIIMMIERAVMRRAAQHKLVLEATERGAAAAVSSNSTGAGVVEVVLQPNAEFVYDLGKVTRSSLVDSAPLDQNTEDLSGAGAYWDSALPSGMTDEDSQAMLKPPPGSRVPFKERMANMLSYESSRRKHGVRALDNLAQGISDMESRKSADGDPLNANDKYNTWAARRVQKKDDSFKSFEHSLKYDSSEFR